MGSTSGSFRSRHVVSLQPQPPPPPSNPTPTPPPPPQPTPPQPTPPLPHHPPPPLQQSWRRGILVSPCPSVCPSVDRIVSALYLQQYSSDPFHVCTSYQATSEGVSRVMFVSKFKNLKFWRILKFCNYDFVFFWHGIQFDSIEWVIIRRQGVSSERRCSSCSSFDCCFSVIITGDIEGCLIDQIFTNTWCNNSFQHFWNQKTLSCVQQAPGNSLFHTTWDIIHNSITY